MVSTKQLKTSPIKLKTHLLQILRFLEPVVSQQFLLKAVKAPTLLPFYHVVSDHPLPHIRHLYPVPSTKKFKADLDWLGKHFTFVDLETFQKSPNPKQLHLTFDDGLQQCHSTIAPILIKKGIPATFFLNSAFLDNKDLMYRYKASLLIDQITNPTTKTLEFLNQHLPGHSFKQALLNIRYPNRYLLDQIAESEGFSYTSFLQQKKPYLSTEQAKQLMQAGFTLGAHSIDHPRYHLISLKEQLFQTTVSINFVRYQFGIPHPPFAFPFTDDGVSKDFFDQLQAQEPECLTFGGAGLKTEDIPNQFQRFPLEKNTYSAKKNVKTEYLYYLIKRVTGKHKINR